MSEILDKDIEDMKTQEVIDLERKRIIDCLVAINCFACPHYDRANSHYCVVGNECGTKETINIVNNGMK